MPSQTKTATGNKLVAENHRARASSHLSEWLQNGFGIRSATYGGTALFPTGVIGRGGWCLGDPNPPVLWFPLGQPPRCLLACVHACACADPRDVCFPGQNAGLHCLTVSTYCDSTVPRYYRPICNIGFPGDAGRGIFCFR